MTLQEKTERLLAAQAAYYNDEPVMTDAEYDQLYEEVKVENPSNYAITKIGSKPVENGWKKVEHKMPMGSLNKAKNTIELRNWAQSNGWLDAEYCLSHKLDGLSIDCVYENGKLIDAITRGDGVIGDSVYSNVKSMNGVKNVLMLRFDGSARGEIILTTENLEKINSILRNEGGKELKTLRNAAAGITKRLDGRFAEYLTVQFYDVTGDFRTKADKFNFIDDCGLRMCWWVVCRLDEIERIYQKYEERIRAQLNFDIDGMVVDINDCKVFKDAGMVNDNPRAAVALKFGPMVKNSAIVNIEWQVGDSGRLTPVAEIEPITLTGATVQKCSLHNYEIFKNLDLNKGDIVEVIRSNDVIPHLEQVVQKCSSGKKFQIPDVCPCCSAPTIIEGKYLVCGNIDCPGKKLGNLNKWIEVTEIMGVGPSIVEMLYENELVRTPADFYKILPDQLLGIERMGRTSAKKIVDSIQMKKELSLDVFIGGLNIPNFSCSKAESLMENGYDTIQKMQALTVEDIVKIKGFEQKTAEYIVRGLQAKFNIILDLLEVVKIKMKASAINNKLQGKSFCVTGTLSFDRKVFIEKVNMYGGVFKSGVGRGLNYLVISDPNSTSTKAQKARKDGITLISEDQFLAMIQ